MNQQPPASVVCLPYREKYIEDGEVGERGEEREREREREREIERERERKRERSAVCLCHTRSCYVVRIISGGSQSGLMFDRKRTKVAERMSKRSTA